MLKDAEIAAQDSPPLETPFHCPLTVFGGWQDQIANPEDFQSWRSYTDGPFDLRMFEGDHFFTERQPERFLEAFLEVVALHTQSQ
jgi:medium-chain acyl-[acyl-carrier-protein] hydrolase